MAMSEVSNRSWPPKQKASKFWQPKVVCFNPSYYACQMHPQQLNGRNEHCPVPASPLRPCSLCFSHCKLASRSAYCNLWSLSTITAAYSEPLNIDEMQLINPHFVFAHTAPNFWRWPYYNLNRRWKRFTTGSTETDSDGPFMIATSVVVTGSTWYTCSFLT